jgi:hypothetical protein
LDQLETLIGKISNKGDGMILENSNYLTHIISDETILKFRAKGLESILDDVKST